MVFSRLDLLQVDGGTRVEQCVAASGSAGFVYAYELGRFEVGRAFPVALSSSHGCNVPMRSAG